MSAISADFLMQVRRSAPFYLGAFVLALVVGIVGRASSDAAVAAVVWAVLTPRREDFSYRG